MSPTTVPGTRMVKNKLLRVSIEEAPVGIEPTNGGFAVLGKLLQGLPSF